MTLQLEVITLSPRNITTLKATVHCSNDTTRAVASGRDDVFDNPIVAAVISVIAPASSRRTLGTGHTPH